MLKTLAQVISVLFHPLLIVTYMLVLLLLINPYLFGVYGIGDQFSRILILQVFLSTFFIPGFAVAMLRFTGLVNSLEMKTKQERIGPYVITGMFYIWMFRNFLGNAQVPTAFSAFLLGAAIGLFIAFFINIFSKISAHAVGMGGLLGMVVITLLLFSYDTFLVSLGTLGTYQVSMLWVLMLTVLLAGLVGTCRLILQAHEPTDLYGGYLVGFVSQFIALRFMF
ncbi:MAG: hypothetical protein HRU12_05865 [Phaeodactylibacter sp.]|nr:hypothetical protein [Phaeodactylibacter sp.]